MILKIKIQSEHYRNIMITKLNTISFKTDKTLTREYDYPFGFCIDLTYGSTGNRPAIEMLTIKGAEYINFDQNGPGQKTGKASGTVSTLVAGYTQGIMGYAGIAVYNPYKSFILTAQR